MTRTEPGTDPYEDPFQRHSYKSLLIEQLKANGGRLRSGRVTVRSARTFGFCWGVDRAVAMVRDAFQEFPGRRIWLLDQIIHNPVVNEDFRALGARFLRGPFAEGGEAELGPDDVVVIPAFSGTVEDLALLEKVGCTVVDTTCPWVVRPHRRTIKYVEDDFTTIIHGLVNHEETRASCSLVASRGGHYLVVADPEEAERLCAVIREELSPAAFLSTLPDDACSEGFDATRDLQRIGTINQTTMLASETRQIESMIRAAMADRWGEEDVGSRFRELNTICRATQENQDSVTDMAETGDLDLLIVVGGYDSSNTRNLTRVAAGRFPCYHVLGPDALQGDVIRHRDPASGELVSTEGWLPAGEITVGFTAGASTPDTLLGETVGAVLTAAGERLDAPATP